VLLLNSALIRLFVKDYKNLGASEVRERYGKFSSIAGIASNFLLFLIKIMAGTLFNSISITADAVNNLSDSGSSLVTLFGFKMSGKPADAEHPYGHARMEYISGLVVSFVILILGVQLIQSSVQKIIHPEAMEFSIISVIILVTAILIKLWQSLFYRKIGKTINSTTLIATSADSRNDILATSSVLVSVLISRFAGINLDGYMGVAVALFILISGVRIVMDTVSPLLGTAPTREFVDKIYRKILTYENIIGLHDLTVHTYGEGKCFASLHCEVPAEQDIMISHDIIDNIERDFLRDEGIHLVIHLDPVVTSDERTNALKEQISELIAARSPDISMHDFRVVWGKTHSNLIFDIVVPFKFKTDDKELIQSLSDEIAGLDENYRCVITVDHSYVPNVDSIE
jgi:cation diffusion facilitator family transporter